MSPHPIRRGLLVMHYGTPASIEEVGSYYTHIRRGRAPSPEQLQDLVERYKSIGGPSPLARISQLQAEAILRGVQCSGLDARLYVGQKHAKPFIEDAVMEMAQDQVDKAVAVVLAPHYSTMSVDSYRHYALEARDKGRPEMRLCFLERWGTLPALIEGLAERTLAETRGWDMSDAIVIFTAHSLPERILAAGDPYKMELIETARLVAEALRIPHWTFAFQSASSAGEPWLGPDILDVLGETAKEGRFKKVLACTVGFVSDHLEVRYDLGIEAKEKCADLGIEFRCAQCINDNEKVMNSVGGLAATLF